MAGHWIKVEHATPDKPEVARIADIVGIDYDAAFGKAMRLWIWADQNSVDGNALNVTESFLDRLTHCTGFASAMRDVGWLEGRDSRLSFPRFDRHNGQSAKKRALTNDRVETHRNAESVTKALPDKIREEEKKRTTNAREKIPKLSDVVEFGKQQCPLIEKQVCESFFHDCASRDLSPNGLWTNSRGQEVVKWEHALHKYAIWWRHHEDENKARRGNNGHSKPQRKTPVL